METIKYNDKEYKMPFDADYNRQKADSFKEEITAIAPRTEALETPIEVTRTPSTDWGGRPCIDTTIRTVDNG